MQYIKNHDGVYLLLSLLHRDISVSATLPELDGHPALLTFLSTGGQAERKRHDISTTLKNILTHTITWQAPKTRHGTFKLEHKTEVSAHFKNVPALFLTHVNISGARKILANLSQSLPPCWKYRRATYRTLELRYKEMTMISFFNNL